MAQHMKHLKTSLETTDDGNEDNRQQIQIYAKDSMDRFGDDLCALLLFFLSLEDRFRCECVSKQFQRTVFESVVDITLCNQIINKIMGTLIDTQLLATIAKKCPNIEIIDCREITYGCLKYMPEVLNAFQNNCRHLREIHVTLWQINHEWMHSFESLVKKISYIRAAFPMSRLNQCSISNFWARYNSDQLLIKNLHTIELNEYSPENNRLLAAFAAQNQCIRSVVIHSSCNQFSNTIVECGQQLSLLTQLRELSLRLDQVINENSLSESLRTIGLNCKQLQRLTLQLMSNNTPLDGQTLDSLRCYHRLKRLRLSVYAAVDPQFLEPLKLCHRLTHLTLELIYNSSEVIDNILNNCGKHWPRLQYLLITCNYFEIKCLSHISRLPALQTLKISTICNFDKIKYLSHVSRLPALQMLVIRFREDIHLSDTDLNAVLSSNPKLKNIEIIANFVKKIYLK